MTRAAPHPGALALAALLLAAPACGGADGGDPDRCPRTPAADIPLVTHASWTRVTAAEDPLGAHRPAAYRCAPGSHVVEGETAQTRAVEVDTRDCNYIALRHPTAARVCKGDRLTVSAWHLNLTAAKKATAHLAIFLGKALLWETRVPIPSRARSYLPTVTATADHPPGTPLLVHLHNHGTNVWTIQQVTVKAR